MASRDNLEEQPISLALGLRGPRKVDRSLVHKRKARARVHAETSRSAETICRRVCVIEGLNDPPGPSPAQSRTLDTLIDRLDEHATLPPRVLSALRAIQDFGAFGAHDPGEDCFDIEAKRVEASHRALCTVVAWYFERYESGGSDQSDQSGESGEASPTVATAASMGLELCEAPRPPGSDRVTAFSDARSSELERRSREPASGPGANWIALLAAATGALLMLASWWNSPVIPL